MIIPAKDNDVQLSSTVLAHPYRPAGRSNLSVSQSTQIRASVVATNPQNTLAETSPFSLT
jgi:hypothetical protein